MIILASSSPRRKELMKEITPSFSIDAADIDESASYSLSPLEAVKDVAYRKGLAVKDRHPNDIVISADTIVTIDNKIIGKPKNEEDAKKILEMLSGRKHQVITAYSIFHLNEVIRNFVVSDVYFEKLDEKLILDYIAYGGPMDKAGAYGIQDDDKFHLVKEIKGSYKNIVGFPVEEIKNDLQANRLI